MCNEFEEEDVAGPVGMTTALCVDTMPGVALGSVEATWTTNEPGSRQASGGEPVGEVKAKDPCTFCCQLAPGG